jgi:hypothetical protein
MFSLPYAYHTYRNQAVSSHYMVVGLTNVSVVDIRPLDLTNVTVVDIRPLDHFVYWSTPEYYLGI